MSTFRKVLLLALITSFSIPAFSQSVEKKTKGVLYYKNFSAGFRLNNHGWAIFSDFGKQLDKDKVRVLRIELMEVKHARELKQPKLINPASGPSRGTSKPFYYGKQNQLYTLHLGYGYTKMITDKASKNGVSVHLSYMAGASIGLLKPYYLVLCQAKDNALCDYFKDERYSDANSERFMDPFSIYGASGWTYGLDEISFIPGAFAKFGILFDFGSYDDAIKAIEIGVSADVFPQRVPMMVAAENNFLFTNLYVSFQMGRRW